MSDYRFISLKVVIDRIMERPLFSSLKLDSAIRWGKWVIEAINNPEFYTKEVETINIESYRGSIPFNFTRCVKVEVIEDTNRDTTQRFSMRTSGDPFLKDRINRNESDNYQEYRQPTYNIEGNHIFVDFEEGKVQMAYYGLPTDTSGYLMVPDNSSIIKAVEGYIKFRHLEILNDLEVVDRYKVEKEEQDYLFYIAQAQSQQFMQNLDKAETSTNIISQLYPDRTQHSEGYRYLGEKEYRRKR